MTMSVRLTGTKELTLELRKAGQRAHTAAGAALFQEAEAVMAESKRLVPVDEGTLRNSGFVRPPTTYVNETTGGGSGVEVTMGYGGASSGHAVFLHEGTGPAVGRPAFFPPVEAFKGWARRVLGDESLAFVIARSVGRKGLRPRKFLENPLMARASTLAARLARRMRGRVERGV